MGPFTLHLALSALHVVCVLFAFAVSITVFVYGTHNEPVFMTNTFFSSSTPSDTGVGWPVSTKDVWPSSTLIAGTDNSWEWNHYYNCMAEARFADSTCGASGEDLGSYANCLRNGNETGPVLSKCSVFSSTYYFQWPTASQYMRCLTSYPVMASRDLGPRASHNTFKKCLDKIQWPSFETVQDVDSQLFLGSYNWGLLSAVGLVIMTSFGVFTAFPFENGALDHDEPEFMYRMGMFWSLLSFVWNLVFLIVFLVVVFHIGNPDNAPVTLWTSMLGLIFISLAIFYFMEEVWGSVYVKQWIQGNVTLTKKKFLNKAGSILKNHGHNAAEEPRHHATAHVGFVSPPTDNARGDEEFGEDGQRGQTTESRLGVKIFHDGVKAWPMYRHKADAEILEGVYAPPLITSWSDGYFADCLIFVGIAGAVGQVETDLVWTIFWMMFLYRLLGSGISRFLYECLLLCGDESYFTDIAKRSREYVSYTYLYDSSASSDDKEKSSPRVDTYGLDLRVMALSSQISAIYIFLALSVLFMRDSLSSFTFQLLAIGGFIVPEAIRGFVNIILLSMGRKNWHAWILLVVNEFLWTWDLTLRAIVILTSVVVNQEGRTGTVNYLHDNWEHLQNNLAKVLSSS